MDLWGSAFYSAEDPTHLATSLDQLGSKKETEFVNQVHELLSKVFLKSAESA